MLENQNKQQQNLPNSPPATSLTIATLTQALKARNQHRRESLHP